MAVSVSMTMDTTSFATAMHRFAAEGAPRAAEAALLGLGEVFVNKLVAYAPRDTNRFVRSYIGAWNSLPRVPKKPMPALKKSKLADRVESRLIEDYNYALRVRIGAQRRLEIGRASCRSRWSPYH